MFVDGYRLVRPGRETEVERALAQRHRANVTAVVAGTIAALGALVSGFALLLPWLNGLDGTETGSLNPFLISVAIIAAALIAGLLVAWLISRSGEGRWKRMMADTTLVRDGYAYIDAYGSVPVGIPAQELWAALDVPGGPSRSTLHPRIMAEKSRGGAGGAE